MAKDFKEKLNAVPELPGSYQMLDETGAILYVGKAKNLKSRLKSYFTGSHDQKTQALVENIADFTYLVTASELEAFLLELSLIKEHSPRYNIMLMDDKTYPYIEITSETHPRIIITRKAKRAKNLFGPFPDAASARETLKLLHRIFPFRKCDALPKEVCLYYHIHQCLGPCVHPVAGETYQEMTDKIRKLLQGADAGIRSELEAKMKAHAENLEFERAREYRDVLDSLTKTITRQNIIFKDLGDRDIINYHAFDHYMAVAILFMRAGRIVFAETRMFEYVQQEEEAFLAFCAQFYEKQPAPREILLPKGTDIAFLKPFIGDRAHLPQKGKKRELVEMAAENARIHFESELGNYLKKHDRTIGALAKLGNLLDIAPPQLIEAFDNSHTLGQAPVSALVAFRNGLPAKKEYRKYQIRTVAGGDDYHSMQEVVYRRYQRLLYEQKRLPDLIITDGGIAQVQAAKAVLDSLYLDVPIVGLKKDDRHKTDCLIDAKGNEYPLDRHDTLYGLLLRIQEEAHRFAISFHRNMRAKEIYASILDAIPAIGPKTKTKLLVRFKTIDNIKNATDKDLTEVGLNRSQIDNLRVALTGVNDK